MRAREFITESQYWYTDYEQVVGYNGIVMGINELDWVVEIYALTPDGKVMGEVQFERKGNDLVADGLLVYPKWRGQNIAKTMYDFAKDQGFNVIASQHQSDDGKNFWKKNRGKERVWEEVVDEIIESVDPYTIFNQVKDIHREFRDIEEGDLPDRIYWFSDYELTKLPLSGINLDEFYLDEDLIEEYIERIKDSPTTMPPIVYDPIANSVIDGMHRANAYARLGYETIPAYVGKTKSDSYGDREEDLDEMALPTDWDPTELGHDKTFKSRLEYAKNRAPKLGGGSSRIAFTIPDNGRPTVLKIAKNKKGLAQNEAEVDILTDGYIKNLDIVIPLIDYDKVNERPIWLQTELAQKASEKQLCDIMKSGKYLFHLTTYASSLIGNPDGWAMGRVREHLRSLSPEDLEIFKEYASEIATLLQATNLKYGDLDRAANWGLYKGRPVIIDLGFTDSVAELY